MTNNVTGKNQAASVDAVQKRPEGASRNVIAHGVECRIEFDKYINGRTAIVLVDAKNGERITTATVDVPTAELQPNHVIIKDHEENDGMCKALRSAGIVNYAKPGLHDDNIGFPVCELLVSPDQKLSRDPASPPKNYDHLMELLGGEDYRRIKVEGYKDLEVWRWHSGGFGLCQSWVEHYDDEFVEDRLEEVRVYFRAMGKHEECPAIFWDVTPIDIHDDLHGFYFITVTGMFRETYATGKPELQQKLDTLVSKWFQDLRDQGFFEQAQMLAQQDQEQEHEISR
jgi:hypothetical protein